MAEIDLAELRRRLAAATHGEWGATYEDSTYGAGLFSPEGVYLGEEEDAVLIVAAVDALPVLLGRLAAAEARAAELDAEVERQMDKAQQLDARLWDQGLLTKRLVAAESLLAEKTAAIQGLLDQVHDLAGDLGKARNELLLTQRDSQRGIAALEAAEARAARGEEHWRQAELSCSVLVARAEAAEARVAALEAAHAPLRAELEQQRDRAEDAEARLAAHEDAIYEHAYKNLVRDVIDALGDDPNDWDYEGSDERLPQAIRDRLVAYEVIRESDGKRIAALTAVARALVTDQVVPRKLLNDRRLCLWCRAFVDEEGHADDCLVGALAALLDGDA
jgi:hypothetical protein